MICKPRVKWSEYFTHFIVHDYLVYATKDMVMVVLIVIPSLFTVTLTAGLDRWGHHVKVMRNMYGWQRVEMTQLHTEHMIGNEAMA